MRCSTVRILAVGAMAVIAALPASATELNGYLQRKGEGNVALSYTTESYDRFWLGDMPVRVLGSGETFEIETESLSLWVDYGITDRLTVVLNLPWVGAEGKGGFRDFEEDALQDLTLLGKYGILARGSGVRHALVGAVGFRTIASNYVANSPVSVGDGTADGLFRLIYQLQAGRFYVSQQVGFDWRGGDAPNGVPLYTELGYNWDRITLNGLYSRVRANGGTDIGESGFTFPSNGDEYERAGAKVFFRVTDALGISAMYFTTLDGRNTGDTTGFSLGVNLRFDAGERTN